MSAKHRPASDLDRKFLWACRDGRTKDALDLLLVQRADPLARNDSGMTGAQMAAMHGMTETCLAILDLDTETCPAEAREGMLHYAAFGGHINTCVSLIDYGCALEEKLGTWTALEYAASRTEAKMCLAFMALGSSSSEILSGNNANVDRIFGLTRLQAAVQWGDARTILMILNEDADPDTLPHRCQEAIDLAKIQASRVSGEGIVKTWLAGRAARLVIDEIELEHVGVAPAASGGYKPSGSSP